jgi:hypothetical protein
MRAFWEGIRSRTRRGFEPIHYKKWKLLVIVHQSPMRNRQVQAELQEAVVAVQNARSLIYNVDLMVSWQAIYPT